MSPNTKKSKSDSIYSVVARASLSRNLQDYLKVAKSRLEENLQYHQAISQKADLPQNLDRIHRFNMLVGYFAQLEAYLVDILADFLTSFPEKMSEKEMRIEYLLEEGAVHRAIKQMAEKTADSLVHAQFSKMAENTLRMFGAKGSLDNELVLNLERMKAERNLFVHKAGKADAAYVAKFACDKDTRIGQPIVPPLVEDVHHAVSRFVQDFHDRGPAKYLEWGKAKAFKAMWRQTLLEKVFPFEQAWEYYSENDMGGSSVICSSDMVFPKELPHKLSCSEHMLYVFFRGIHNPDYCDGTVGLPAVIDRFDRSSPERTIIDAWMENPFFF